MVEVGSFEGGLRPKEWWSQPYRTLEYSDRKLNRETIVHRGVNYRNEAKRMFPVPPTPPCV